MMNQGVAMETADNDLHMVGEMGPDALAAEIDLVEAEVRELVAELAVKREWLDTCRQAQSLAA